MRFRRAVLILFCVPAVGFSADSPVLKFDPKRGAEEKVLLPNLRTWFPPQGYVEAAFHINERGATGCAFSPVKHQLAIGSETTLRILDLKTGRLVRVLPAVSNAATACHLIDYSPDGKRIACLAPRSNKVRVFDIETTAVVAELTYEGYLVHLAFSADGSTLAAVQAGTPFRVVTWKTKDWKRAILPIADRKAPTWASSRSGTLLAHSSSQAYEKVDTDAIDVWNLVTGECRTIKTKLAVSALTFGADEKTLYVACIPGTRAKDETELGVIDLTAGGEKSLFKIRGGEVSSNTFTTSPDGKYVVLETRIAPAGPRVRLIELATGKERWSGLAFGRYLEFSPGGAMVATVSDGSVVYSVEDLLNPMWADLAEGIAAARAENLSVSLTREGIRVSNQFNIGPEGFAAVAKTLPGATHLEISSNTDPKAFAAFGQLSALKGLTEISLSFDTKFTDEALRGLPVMPQLESLTLRSCSKLTAGALAHVAKFKGLRRLDLSANPWVTDDALAELAGLVELRHLSLGGTKLTGAGLKHLAKLTKLESLNLSGVKSGDDDLAVLAPMIGMTELVIGYDSTDAGLRHLKGMAGLRVLSLGGAKKVTGSGFADLTCLPKLEVLQLSGSGVTDANLAHLAVCTELRTLNIENTELKGAGLSHLKGCKKLTRLEFRDVQIDDKGYEAIGELAQLHMLRLAFRAKTSALVPLKTLKNLDELNLIDTSIGRDGEIHLAQMTQLRLLTLSPELSKSDIGVTALRKALPTTHIVVLPR